MTDIINLFSEAELALAAYADLLPGSLTDQRARLESAGMSAKQAEEFAERYPIVVTQFNDTDTSFSATVFKDSEGNLTLAIRGTLELSGSPSDLSTDYDIFAYGAGYEQIVAMYNWWRLESSPSGQWVEQYEVRSYLDGVDTVPEGAVPLYKEPHGHTAMMDAYYLVEIASEKATGNLTDDIAIDSDHKLDVTGHSLGGHLAMAFGSLFPGVTDEVSVFNAPGFRATSANTSFFSKLGGSIPSGVNTTNVIADEAGIGDVTWSAIAGLNNRPGTAIDIAIEDQWASDEQYPTSARNHSQQTITDALAVYATLSKLDPSLSTGEFKWILDNAASGTAVSLEHIVDALDELFTKDTTNLTVGNLNRDDLYVRLYTIQEKDAFTNAVGKLNIVKTQVIAGHVYQNNGEGLAYRYALLNLNPFAITGDASIYSTHNNGGVLDWYNPETGTGTLTTQYLEDRSQMLDWLLKYNETDTDYGDKLDSEHVGSFVGNYHYTDYSHKNVFGKPMLLIIDGEGTDTPYHQIKFGSEEGEFIEGVDPDFFGGGNGVDNLYGMGGNDTLQGKGGNDYIEGGFGDDSLTGGQGDDRLVGGAGNDKFYFSSGDGSDSIIDKDHAGDEIIIDGVNLKTLNFAETSEGGDCYIDKDFNDAEENAEIILTKKSSGLIVISTKDGVTDFIKINHFDNGDFGITLNEYKEEEYEIGAKQYVYDSRLGVYNPVNDYYDPDPVTYQYRHFDLVNEGVVQGPGDAAVYYWQVGMSMELHAAQMDYPFLGNGRAWVDGDDLDDVIYGAYGLLEMNGVKSNHHNDLVRGKGGDDLIYGDYDPFPSDPYTHPSGWSVSYDDIAVIDADQHGDDFITGGCGSDTIYGNGGDDTIYGVDEFRTGRYTWFFIEGVWNAINMCVDMHTWDTFYYDTVLIHDVNAMEEEGDQDTIYGGEGDDRIYAGSYGDFLFGEDGNDRILGGAGSDLINGGANADVIFGDSYVRFNNVNAAPEPDWTSEKWLDDNSFQVTTSTRLWEGGKFVTPDLINTIKPNLSYNDTIVGGSGNDMIFGEIGDDIIIGGTGDDILIGDRGAEYLSSVPVLYSEVFYDTKNWNASYAYLFPELSNITEAFADDEPLVLDAELNGDDTIYGGDGSDIIYGNGGNDFLDGGNGSDTYYFDEGFGHDVVGSSMNGQGFNDTIHLNGDVALQTIKGVRQGSDLMLWVGDSDSILIMDFYCDTNPIGWLRFDNGLTLDYQQIANLESSGPLSAGIDEISVDQDADVVINVDDLISNDTNSYNAVLTVTGINNEKHGTVTFNSETGSIVFSPVEGYTGFATFEYDITDGVNTATGTVVVSVGLQDDIQINHAPVLENPIDNHVVAEDSQFIFQIPEATFFDSDSGDTLSLSADLADGSALPGWLSFDPIANTLSGTPDNSQVGSLDIRITATDNDGESVFDTFTLDVANVNDAPIVDVGISDQQTLEDHPFNFVMPGNAFGDDDLIHGDSLTLSASLADGSSLPSWLSFDAVTGIFSGTPTNDDVGDISLKVVATDLAGATAEAVFGLNVVNVNDAPELINTLADADAVEGDSFSYTIPSDAFRDIDAGDSLTYTATLANGDALPGWLSLDSENLTLSGELPMDAAGDYDITIQATDQSGAGVSDTFHLSVTNLVQDSNWGNVLQGSSFNDLIIGDAGSEWLYGYDGDDHLIAGGGSDLLNGGAGNDLLVAGSGNDILYGSSGDDILYGGEGNDDLYGGSGDDVLIGDNDAQSDPIVENGFFGNWFNFDWFGGIRNDDMLWGGEGNDSLQGGAGMDALYGGEGDDVLDGGTGNDVLNGGRGSDTYRFSLLDGQDIIYNHDTGTDDIDVLSFDGIANDDLLFSRQWNNLVIHVVDTNDRVTVNNWFRGEGYQLDSIEADDATLQNDQVNQLVNAMAVFNVPMGFGSVVPQEVRDQSGPVLVSSWM